MSGKNLMFLKQNRVMQYSFLQSSFNLASTCSFRGDFFKSTTESQPFCCCWWSI